MLDSHLEQAFSLAVHEVRKRGHEYFTLEHLLLGIVSQERGQVLLDSVGVDIVSLRRKLERFFAENITPVSHRSETEVVQTVALQRVMQRSLRHIATAGKQKIGIGDVLASLLEEENSYAAFFLLSQGVTRLDLLEFLASDSAGTAPGEEEAGGETDADAKALKKFTTDLTARAERGEMDPLVGRERELQRAVQILARRRKNNPLFVGDPGVGKTALAEGIAMRIAAGDMPAEFRGAKLFSLDLGGMMAGTRYRGDFEARLKSVLAALVRIPQSILFVDEIHTLVGAGAVSGGSLDASNILKPALASGQLRCIGSTTYEELRNQIEKDRAFSRRFQKIDVGEPDNAECLAILQGLKERYEDYHQVRYTPAALEAAVTLSARYLPDARLPDKAIDLIDEAGARRRLRRDPAPARDAAAEEDRDRKKRGKTPGAGGENFPGRKTSRRAGKEAALHFSGTGAIFLLDAPVREEERAAPLTVGVADVEQVVQSIARIPSVKANAADKAALRHLERDLKRVVFGQAEAVGTVTRAVLRSRAGFRREGRPQGAFLFHGPTGVGKTELAKQLAATLGAPLLRYDMSEYMEKHAVSRFIGAPPGYVGFEQGGMLVEAVRKNPQAVLLLDEMEKAHPDVFNVLLQVMDYATLTDSSGRKADFRNVVLIMTTNAGAFEMSARNIGFGAATGNLVADKGRKVLERLFTPEFRNRLDAIVPFAPLSPEVMSRIVDKFMAELAAGLAERRVHVALTRAAAKYLARAGYDPVYGARPLARVMRERVEDPLASELLFGRLKNGGKVTIDAAPGEKSGVKAEKRSDGEKEPGLCFRYETPAKSAGGEKTGAKGAALLSARETEDLEDSPAG